MDPACLAIAQGTSALSRDVCALVNILQRGDAAAAFDCWKCRRPGATQPVPSSPGSTRMLPDCEANESAFWNASTPCLGDMCMPLNRAVDYDALGRCVTLDAGTRAQLDTWNLRVQAGVLGLQFLAQRQPLRAPSYDTMVLLRTFGRSVRGGFCVSCSRGRPEGIMEDLGPVGEALTSGNQVGIVVADSVPQELRQVQAGVVQELRTYLLANTYTFQYTEFLDWRQRPFETERLAVNYTEDGPGSGVAYAVVALRGDRAYTIRMNSTTVPATQTLRSYQIGLNSEYIKYMGAGFITMQQTVDDFWAQRSGLPVPQKPFFSPMPLLSYDVNTFLRDAGEFVPLLLCFAFLVVVSLMTSAIVREKEDRIREGMLIMGLRPWVFRFSWWFVGFVEMVAVSFTIAGILKASLTPNTDYFLLFLIHLFYTTSIITISMCLSSLFSRAKDASATAPFIFLGMMLPLMLNVPKSSRGPTTLLSTFAYAVCMENIFLFEGSGEGVTWDQNFDKPDGDVFTREAFVMLVVDNVIYLLITFYLDQVVPSEWGTQKHPLFCLMCCCTGGGAAAVQPEEEMAVTDKIEAVVDSAMKERETVKLHRLRKAFGAHVAVEGLSMSMYQGHCTVLLGHNGAGKTTTINMLTGMMPATAGDAEICGNSVKHDMQSVRNQIGLCPQHNILWAELSCADHLRFYGRLKGMSGDSLEETVDAYLQDVELMPHPQRSPHLPNKKNAPSGHLSGGQKRKLCVAISLIGGPAFVIFDEPTAGMDVEARRAIWDLLKREKEGRAMLLTTHFMDEADLLGDRIAIMHHGKLYCCGSSLFLKSRLGAGYCIKLDMMQVGRDEKEGQLGTVASLESVMKDSVRSCDGVKDTADEIECLSAAGSEVVFLLPLRSVPAFPTLFEALESRRDELGIRGFGVSVTTLEEIFIRIAHEDVASSPVNRKKLPARTPASKMAKKSPSKATAVSTDDEIGFACPEDVRIRGAALFPQHVRAMMYKRIRYTRRDKRTLCIMMILPPIIIAFALGMSKLLNITLDQPFLDITPAGNGYRGGTELVVGPSNTTVPPFLPPDYSYIRTAATDWTAMELFLNATARSHGNVERLTGVSLPVGIHGPYHCPGGNCMSFPLPDQPLCLHNNSFWHALPMAMAALTSVQHQEAVTVSNHPFPETKFIKEVINSILIIFEGLLVLVPFTFIPSTYTSFLVRERVVKSKHVQLVSGVRLWAFWLGTFVWDVAMYCVTMALCLIFFAIYSRDEYVGDAEVGMATFLHLLLYGVSSIGMSYWMSFYFDDHSKAQTYVLTGNFVCGWILVLVAQILLSLEQTRAIAEVLRFPFRAVPAYCLGDGLITLSSRTLLNTFADFTGDGSIVPPVFDFGVERGRGAAWNLVFMACEIPLFFFIALSHDFPHLLYKLHLRKPPEPEGPTGDVGRVAEDEDADVTTERGAVEKAGGREGDLVVVQRLRKEFRRGSVVAVRNLSFGVREEEIFALLGTNGAGKTTTLSVLSGEFHPTCGRASINGHDVVTQTHTARQQLGYCPQFDALLDLLTPREHLRFYAMLRGVPEDMVDGIADSLIEILQLEENADKQCKDLSGGNKRKASIAISLVGGPAVLFLDEPTAGMDPVARRGMWRALQSIGKGRSVVLTTHHLEEVEALAHRVAIMVAGDMKCIGSLTHLKNKFGGGYEVDLKAVDADAAKRLREHVSKDDMLRTAQLKEQAGERLTYQIDGSTPLSKLFRKIESLRDPYHITDYSINQTSLEQVFMAICRQELLREQGALQQVQETARSLSEDQAQAPPAQLDGVAV
eukprot:TRINITY_DN137_c0_g2_i1.p1 TRINITY_DN137_c0_g2~~TRINITY_DN137_c0_g2_i1.p1  ORF type:complete len:1909 (+),score=587.90 TRINITY_DN137_c0_g2_i1:349-5727(+)